MENTIGSRDGGKGQNWLNGFFFGKSGNYWEKWKKRSVEARVLTLTRAWKKHCKPSPYNEDRYSLFPHSHRENLLSLQGSCSQCREPFFQNNWFPSRPLFYPALDFSVYSYPILSIFYLFCFFCQKIGLLAHEWLRQIFEDWNL